MNSEKASKGSEMSEAAYAQELCFQIALPARLRGESRKGQISYVHREVNRHSRDGWTWRRVKAFIYGEVSDGAVRARELRELEDTAELIRKAREQHAEFIAETERLAAFYLRQDADFIRPEIEARRSVVGRVGRAGTGGAAE